MLVHDQPLPVLLLKHDRPSEIPHLALSRFHRRIFLHRRRTPIDRPGSMKLRVVIHRQRRRFEIGQHRDHALLILVPAAVLQRREVKKHMRPRRIERRRIHRIQRAPRVPDLLHQSPVRNPARRLRRLLLRLSERQARQQDHPKQRRPDPLSHLNPPHRNPPREKMYPKSSAALSHKNDNPREPPDPTRAAQQSNTYFQSDPMGSPRRLHRSSRQNHSGSVTSLHSAFRHDSARRLLPRPRTASEYFSATNQGETVSDAGVPKGRHNLAPGVSPGYAADCRPSPVGATHHPRRGRKPATT